MSLRARFLVYLILIHLLFAVTAFYALRELRLWLLIAEGVLLVSLLTGVVLVRMLFEPLGLIRSGAEFIRENDFTTRFTEVGPPEMTDLIRVYNRMVDNLREERIRNREQEYFLRDVVAATPAGVITLDLDGRITSVNPAAEALLGRRHGALLGKRLDKLGSSFAAQLLQLRPGAAQIFRLRGRRRVKCQRLSFLDRGFARPFLILEELTDELHRSEKAAYGKLIRMMSHEVNNTVGAVSSLLQSCHAYSVQLREGDREEFVGALDVAVSRARNMNEFMQGFADVVRLPTPRRVPTALRGLLEDVVRLLQGQAAARSITWHWEITAEPGSVRMDPGQMEQVFINVLKNAIEAIGREGTITIHLGVSQGRPLVVIRDTGGGIAPEVQQELFTPFFTTKATGQGIGLTLVQEILLAHGFDFALTAETAGETEFRVVF